LLNVTKGVPAQLAPEYTENVHPEAEQSTLPLLLSSPSHLPLVNLPLVLVPVHPAPFQLEMLPALASVTTEATAMAKRADRMLRLQG